MGEGGGGGGRGGGGAKGGGSGARTGGQEGGRGAGRGRVEGEGGEEGAEAVEMGSQPEHYLGMADLVHETNCVLQDIVATLLLMQGM